MKKRVVGVIGAGECDDETYQTALELGELIASSGYTLLCGGLGGVMEGAARGAIGAGGVTVGILPGVSSKEANSYISIPIVTGLGHSRNVLVVQSSECLVAVSGGLGTLSEIAIALKIDKTVIGLNTWKNLGGVIHVNSPMEALNVLNKTLAL